MKSLETCTTTTTKTKVAKLSAEWKNICIRKKKTSYTSSMLQARCHFTDKLNVLSELHRARQIRSHYLQNIQKKEHSAKQDAFIFDLGSDYRYACPDAMQIKGSVCHSNCVDLIA